MFHDKYRVMLTAPEMEAIGQMAAKRASEIIGRADAACRDLTWSETDAVGMAQGIQQIMESAQCRSPREEQS